MRSSNRSNAALVLVPVHPTSEPLDALVRRALTGDRAALDRVVRALRPRLVREAARRLGSHRDPADAEDIVHDLFVALLEKKALPPAAREDAVAWLVRLVGTFVPR